MKYRKSLGLKIILSVLLCSLLTILYLGVNWWRSEFVFITVEESSLNAITGWPLSSPELSQVFIDVGEKLLEIPDKPNLFGVSLGVYYSASSQGIEFKETLDFSRRGKLTLNLPAPVSLTAPNIQGETVELINNQARVVPEKLIIKKTERDGTVHLQYGRKKFELKPNESWAELLVLYPDGPKAVSAEEWQTELQKCFDLGYPATRLAVANRGLWPKSGIKVGIYQ